MERDQDRLERVAQAVADGSPVNWDKEGVAKGARAQVDKLHAIRRVSEILAPGGATEAMASVESGVHTWGGLELRAVLGTGSYGEVWRAYDPKLQSELAVKILHARPGQTLEDLLGEARKHVRVKHPNVAQIYGVEERDGQVGIRMELIEGETLERLLDEHGSFGAEEATQIGSTLARALAAVHKEGIVHGDVKTTNVMREKGGRIVLMDFSSATESGGEEGTVGTPLFMAPELFNGESATVVSDIYSLGALVYRLVTRRHPVEGLNVAEILDAHDKGMTPLLDARPDLDPDFVRTVERALSKRPGDRFQSAGDMERALAALVPPPAPIPLPIWRRYAPLVLTAAGIVLAALIALWIGGFGESSIRVRADLFRLADEGSVRLDDGGAVHAGEKFYLEVESGGPFHAYVLNQDGAGNTYVLFPLPEAEPGNPLAGKTRHRLPGSLDGDAGYWVADSVEGQEHLFMVASREPHVKMEALLKKLPRVGVGGPIAIRDDDLRGFSKVSPGPNAGSAGASGDAFLEAVSSLSNEASSSKDLKVWSFRLRNVGLESDR